MQSSCTSMYIAPSTSVAEFLTIKVALQRLLCGRGWWEEPGRPGGGGERGGSRGPSRDQMATGVRALPASLYPALSAALRR